MTRHEDLELEKGFMTQEELTKTPVVSIIIYGDMPSEKINMILGSIYNQLFPRFEILATEEIASFAEDSYRDKANFRVACSREQALREAKGSYVLLFDEFAMFTKNSLREMVKKLEAKPNLGFAAMLMKRFDGEGYSPIPELSASYGYIGNGKTRFNKLTEYDGFFSNKLFRKSVLEGFRFGENSSEDVMRLYRNLRFEKLRKGTMITDISQEDMLRKLNCGRPRMRVKWGCAKNEAVAHAIQNLKRHITKEDIDRLKRKIGR